MKLLFIIVLLAALTIDYMVYNHLKQTGDCGLSPQSACKYLKRLP